MLDHPPTRRSLPRRRPHLAAPPRRTDGLDAARRTAQRSRDARDRLWAGALETLVTFIPATVALAFTVDERRLRRPVMAYTGTHGGDQAEAVVRRFAETEPIDPFAVLRAELRGARVLSACDMDDVAGSLYGRHLARSGFGIPLCAYIWRGDRIVAGVALVRRAGLPGFDRAAAALLAQLQPLLEDALTGAAALPREAPSRPLTARERDVVEHVLAGESNAEIAVALGMSEKTVKTHLTHVYEKVGVRSRTELTVRLGAAPRSIAA
jgi:DNA-binding CsgD family transcriptional regulator